MYDSNPGDDPSGGEVKLTGNLGFTPADHNQLVRVYGDFHGDLLDQLGLADAEIVLVSSRRGGVEAPVRIDESLRPGLVFMTFHFPEQVDVNVLTIEAIDPKSGTAEFKASAVRIDKLRDRELVAGS